MSRHYETQNGLCETVDEETQSYVFNQTMLRIKDPVVSLDFYTRIIGMKLYRKLDFPEMEFTLYFLGMPADVDDENVLSDSRFNPTKLGHISITFLPTPYIYCDIRAIQTLISSNMPKYTWGW